MEMKIRGILRMTAVLALLLVIGCGSNGSGGSSGSPVGVASGQIIDSLLQGLDYRSASSSGLTDAQGAFSHGTGETVTFSIGDLEIGSTQGKPIATLLDLVPGARLVDVYGPLEWTTSVNSQRVKNIARFLQSLDSDCNVTNGIQITSQIRAEVSPRLIDFDQSSSDFGSNPVIADVFDRLNAAGAFSGGCAAALRPEPVAVEHLAKSIRDTWMLAGGSIDRNGDGVFDGARQIVRNASGRVTEHTDFGADWVLYREYDDASNTETIRRDDGRNGTIDYIWRTTYDEQRRIVKEEEDWNGDGVFDNENTIQRDAFGRETGRMWHAYATGQTYRYRTEYDADGNITLEETDSDDDGTIDYTYRYTYVGGKRTKQEHFYPGGSWTRLYTYDGNNLVSETADWQDDGILDWRTDHTYDSNGNRLTTKQYDFKDLGGVFTWFLSFEETFVFNLDNLYIEQTIVFHDSGGGLDETHRQLVTRDSNNNITRTEWIKSNGVTEIETFIWEEQSIPSAFDIYIQASGPLAFS